MASNGESSTTSSRATAASRGMIPRSSRSRTWARSARLRPSWSMPAPSASYANPAATSSGAGPATGKPCGRFIRARSPWRHRRSRATRRCATARSAARRSRGRRRPAAMYVASATIPSVRRASPAASWLARSTAPKPDPSPSTRRSRRRWSAPASSTPRIDAASSASRRTSAPVSSNPRLTATPTMRPRQVERAPADCEPGRRPSGADGDDDARRREAQLLGQLLRRQGEGRRSEAGGAAAWQTVRAVPRRRELGDDALGVARRRGAVRVAGEHHLGAEGSHHREVRMVAARRRAVEHERAAEPGGGGGRREGGAEVRAWSAAPDDVVGSAGRARRRSAPRGYGPCCRRTRSR